MPEWAPVAAIAAQGTVEFNTLTSTLAILIGAFFLLFGALRLGWVAVFIPTPVMRRPPIWTSSEVWYFCSRLPTWPW
jgi:hypothetical protein